MSVNSIKLVLDDLKINEIIKNIKNNNFNKNEIMYLAKYGAYHNIFSLIQLAYNCNLDIYVSNDYLFRMAIKTDNCDLICFLFSCNFEYFELFLNKKYIHAHIFQIIYNILYNKIYSGLVGDQQWILLNQNEEKLLETVFEKSLCFAFDKNHDFDFDTQHEISPQVKKILKNILNRNTNLYKLLLRDFFTSIISQSTKLIRLTCENVLFEETQQLIKINILEWNRIDMSLWLIIGISEYITPKFVHELFIEINKNNHDCYGKIFDILTENIPKKQHFIDYLVKKEDVAELVILWFYHSKFFEINELKILFKKKNVLDIIQNLKKN